MWDLMGNNYSEVYGIGYALLNGISAGFYVSVMYKDLGDEIYFYYLDNAPYGNSMIIPKIKLKILSVMTLTSVIFLGRTDHVGSEGSSRLF